MRDFADNKDVSFGDVNLSKEKIRDYGAGQGGMCLYAILRFATPP